jgi:hypothetical protein
MRNIMDVNSAEYHMDIVELSSLLIIQVWWLILELWIIYVLIFEKPFSIKSNKKQSLDQQPSSQNLMC